MAQGLFRMLLAKETAKAWRGVLVAKAAMTLPSSVESMTPIQKMVVLQDIPIFSRASADQLMGLAGITRQVPLGPAGA